LTHYEKPYACAQGFRFEKNVPFYSLFLVDRLRKTNLNQHDVLPVA